MLATVEESLHDVLAVQLASQLEDQLRVAPAFASKGLSVASSHRFGQRQIPERWVIPPHSGGLLGIDGRAFTPNVVRIGAGALTTGRPDVVKVRLLPALPRLCAQTKSYVPLFRSIAAGL
jgi:hypothetical protein